MNHTPTEIDEIIEMGRLYLYNRGEPCGPASIQVYLAEQMCDPIPSTYRIKKVLRERELIYGWTRDYPQEQLINR